MGVTIGLVLAYSFFFGLTYLLPEAAFLSWGWRLPFIFSLILVMFGLWIRKSLNDTPAFRKLKEEAEQKVEQPKKLPIIETFKKHPKEVIMTVCAKFVETAPFYIFSTFIVGYATATLKLPFEFMMLSIMVVSIATTVLIPVMGLYLISSVENGCTY